jgi:hypothetical protein
MRKTLQVVTFAVYFILTASLILLLLADILLMMGYDVTGLGGGVED